MILNQLFTESSNWHTDPEQQSMDATRRARLGREREPEGSDAIDAQLAANNNARQQYAETGRFWLKQKDTQQHLNDQPYTGKAAANAAALELLKQQPELRGNLVITAYGPGEQQVTEGKVKELGQDLKDRALSDDDFKKKYSKTRAEVRAAMREKQGVAEGPGFDKWADDRAASQLHKLKPGMVQDRKTGKWYDPKKEFEKKMNSPEVMAQMNRMSQKEGVAENIYSGTDDTVGFSVNSEAAYQAVMARFGDSIDHDETSGIMYVPTRMWPQVEMVAFDADGEGATQADGLDEGEKVGNMDADRFDDAMARLKQLAGAGPMKTVYDPAKRVYKNVPVAQQPGDKK
jgi:hypothetical protein